MKKPTNPNIKAHLLRSAFYLILLVAVGVIPFALGQFATTTKQSAVGTLPTSDNPDSTGTWTFTGSLNNARFDHTETLLPNGKVLVAGGYVNGRPSGHLLQRQLRLQRQLLRRQGHPAQRAIIRLPPVPAPSTPAPPT